MSKSISSAAEAERHAEKARQDLTATLDQLKQNLKPRQLAGEAMAATRARTPDWLLRYWDLAGSPAGLGLIGATAASITLAVLEQRRRARRLTR